MGTAMKFTSIEQLHEDARANAGLEDFGDDAYLEGLERLLGSIESEAALTAAGTQRMLSIVGGALESRLRTEASWARHPGHERVDIVRPIFVTGLPRTGTTALHRLLTMGTNHQGLELWLAQSPQPRPAAGAWASNPDYRRVEEAMQERRRAQPRINGIHFMTADVVEECWRIEHQTMKSVAFESLARIPGYSTWLAGQNMDDVYARHRKILQLIGMNTPEKRWVLKHPGHLFALDSLMKAYPDALIVQTHRDPTTIVPSVSSLNVAAMAGAYTDYDKAEIGQKNLELWARGADRFAQARARYDPDQFVDIRYEDFVADAVGAVESVYSKFGIDFDEATRAAVDQAHAESKVGERRPSHRYDLAEFGLTKEQVEERFASYLTKLADLA